MSWLCIRVNTTQQEILKLGNQQIYNNNDIQLISNNCKNKKILIRNIQKKVMEKNYRWRSTKILFFCTIQIYRDSKTPLIQYICRWWWWWWFLLTLK